VFSYIILYMKSSAEIQKRINTLSKNIIPVIKRYPITKVGVFGSILGSNYNSKSDVDLLIEIDPNAKLGLEYMELISELEKATNKKVDLVQYKNIRKPLINYILPSEVRIYEKGL
jgi:uncharacterized protein